jgi:hypothetical protein
MERQREAELDRDGARERERVEKAREREREKMLQERDRLIHARWVCLSRTLEQGITALDETGRRGGESMSAEDG